MQPHQRQFIQLALDAGVLLFGEFTLKSGRVSPYFFNAGLFNTGESLSRLADCYAAAIRAAAVPFDMLFGPAYKGIPLVSAIAVSLFRDHDVSVPWSFNRKEVKDHGESGAIVGAPLAGGVLVVDDVISAGTSARESVDIIDAVPGARPAGLAIGLDRQERGAGARSAVQEVEQALGLPVIRIVTLNDLVEFLDSEPGHAEALAAVRAYRERYGVDT